MRQSDAARGAARPSVPAHAVEIRPDEPYTPEEWDYLCAVVASAMADPVRPSSHGVRCAGGSVFVWTDSPDSLPLADAMGMLLHLVLRRCISGREVRYTLHR